MVAIAAHDLAPLGGEPALVAGGVRVKAGTLRPHKEAEPVGPVQPPRVLDLLMLARTVEAERLRKLDVAAQRLVGRRSQQPVQKVALVQDQPLDEGRAVQPEATVPGLDLAEPEVAADAIDGLAAMAQRCLELVQHW